jgi:hypothetical protein
MKMLAILKKDARRLWPQMLLFWLLLALSAWLDPVYSGRMFSADFAAITMALVLACGTLIVAAIQQEALPGDTQYWLTRPIDRRALWVEKAAFVFLAVNLPIVAGQVIIYIALGIPLGGHLGALLWRQVFFIAFLILPAAVLGAVTRNLGQVFLTTILIVAVNVGVLSANVIRFVIPVPIGVWGASLLNASLAAVGAAAVLWIQYARRSTAVARAVMLTTMLLMCLTTRMATPPVAEPGIVALELDAQPVATARPPAPLGSLEFPIRIDGIPAGVDITVDRMRAGIGEPGGATPGLLHSLTASIHDFSTGRGWLTIYNGQEQFEKYLNVPVNLYASLDLVLSTRGAALPRPGKAGVVVPAIGRCTEQDDTGVASVVCYSPFPRTALALQWTNGTRQWIVSLPPYANPLATPLGFRTLDRYTLSATDLAGARLVAGNIVARHSATIDFERIRLSNYLPHHR